jgi:hypothetical protein
MRQTLIGRIEQKSQVFEEEIAQRQGVIAEDVDAIKQVEHEIVVRSDLADRLREQVAIKAASKGRKEQEIFGTVDQLKKIIVAQGGSGCNAGSARKPNMKFN